MLPGLGVDLGRILLEQVVVAQLGRLLQGVDDGRAEEVLLAVATPLQIAAGVELGRRLAAAREGLGVPLGDLLCNGGQIDAADARGRPREVAVNDRLVDADRLEDLRAAIARDRGDAHLGHGLDHALDAGLDVVLAGLLEVDLARVDIAALQQMLHGLEGEVGVDRVAAIADQHGVVMHLARFAGLQDNGDLGPETLVD